jgi:PTS system nitrogen regulatory IIA component
MPLADLLAPERIVLLTDPGDRDSVLDAAARLLSDGSPDLTSGIADALREREKLASTAIGHGVAIPHARGRTHVDARGAFLRLQRPVDFGGQLVDMVFALVAPEHSPQQHLQALSELADRFADAIYRDAVREAPDLPTLRELLLGGAQRVREAAP